LATFLSAALRVAALGPPFAGGLEPPPVEVFTFGEVLRKAASWASFQPNAVSFSAGGSAPSRIASSTRCAWVWVSTWPWPFTSLARAATGLRSPVRAQRAAAAAFAFSSGSPSPSPSEAAVLSPSSPSSSASLAAIALHCSCISARAAFIAFFSSSSMTLLERLLRPRCGALPRGIC